MWIFLILVAVPIVEIALFIEVGGWIGLWPTLAIVIATALAGTMLLRAQGFAAMADLQRRIDSGRDPTGVIAHGALILVAGLLLLTPGFFTDALGFALLVPPVRAAVLRFAARRVRIVRSGGSPQPGDPNPADATVEGAYEVIEPDGGTPPPRPDPGSGSAPGQPGGR